MPDPNEGQKKGEAEEAAAAGATGALLGVMGTFLGVALCGYVILIPALLVTWMELHWAKSDASFYEERYNALFTSSLEDRQKWAADHEKLLNEKYDAESETRRVRRECAREGVYVPYE